MNKPSMSDYGVTPHLIEETEPTITLSEKDRLELLRVLSRTEGFMFGVNTANDEYIFSQLEYATNILMGNKDE